MNLSDLTIRIAADTAPVKQGLSEITSNIARMDKSFEQSFRNMGTQFNRHFTSAVKGDVKQVGSVFSGLLRSMENTILSNFIGNLRNGAVKSSGSFGGLVTGVFSGGLLDKLIGGLLGGGKAAGGNVAGGTPVMVGERGPEMFVPFSGGKIVPNQQLGASQGGAVNIHMTVVTPDAGSFRASQGQILSEAALAMSRARRNL
jgi:phage-related minor tail protein